MSRYLLLVLINLPFILAALLSALTQYKLGKSSKKRFLIQLFLWLIILGGLIVAEPTYTYLFNNKLTVADSLSLFDVAQITGIVLLFYVVNRLRAKTEVLERRLQDLHRELSIILSKRN